MIEKLTTSIITNIFRITGKECPQNLKKSAVQFVKFGIVGVSNTIISYLLYAGTLLLLKKFEVLSQIDYLVAQGIAFVLSVLWSFYWNNRMVFTLEEGQSRNLWAALLKTYISYSFTGLFLNSILLILWVKVLHISEFIAPLLNLIISVPLNFIVNKFWAFQSKESNELQNKS